MKIPLKIMIILSLVFSSFAFAEKQIVEVWQCKLLEGKTMKEVAALNDRWVKFMNATVKGGGINSYDLEPRVGNQETFMFVDVYPNLESWAAGDNVMENDKGVKSILKELKLVVKCSSNTLYTSTKH